jgi:hypothetical protein
MVPGDVTEDDGEVAVSYAEEADLGRYYPNNASGRYPGWRRVLRTGIWNSMTEGPDVLEEMRLVYYEDRTRAPRKVQQTAGWVPASAAKRDRCRPCAQHFHEYTPAPVVQLRPEHLSLLQALYKRDRRIEIKSTDKYQIGTCATHGIAQQHVDAYVLLHNPEYERICWDAANQDLALMLRDQLCVTVTFAEIERETVRFQLRSGIETAADFARMLETNGWSRPEYDRLIIHNARIRKLQHANTVSKMYRRNTQSIIDYLRTHQAFDYWAGLARPLKSGSVMAHDGSWRQSGKTAVWLNTWKGRPDLKRIEEACYTWFSNVTERVLPSRIPLKEQMLTFRLSNSQRSAVKGKRRLGITPERVPRS